MNDAFFDEAMEMTVSLTPQNMKDETFELKRKLGRKFRMYASQHVFSSFLNHKRFIAQYIHYANCIIAETNMDSRNYWISQPKANKIMKQIEEKILFLNKESENYLMLSSFLSGLKFQVNHAKFMLLYNSLQKQRLEKLLIFLNDESNSKKERIKRILEMEDELEMLYVQLYDEKMS